MVEMESGSVVTQTMANAPEFKNFLVPQKVVFVAHEFGLHNGHGGIASYLYNICKYLLEETDVSIYVLSITFDERSDLLESPRFHYFKLSGDLTYARIQVKAICADICPDYIEFADFSALGLECVLSAATEGSFRNSVLVTNCHSASKECYEWSSLTKIGFAPPATQELYRDEALQMSLSDHCIAPSRFLASYVRYHYRLREEVHFFANPYIGKLESGEQIYGRLKKSIDLSGYEDSFNIVLVSRFEGRKRQIELVNCVQNIYRRTAMDIRLFLAGNTATDPNTGREYRTDLLKNIDHELFDRIQLFDFVDLKGQEKFFAIADLAVMPSVFENQPMSMMETVLRGVPVLASRYSGCADYTRDKELLFDPFVQGDLERRIQSFAERPLEDRREVALQQYNLLLRMIDPSVSIIPRMRLLPSPLRESKTRISLEDMRVGE